MYIERTFDDFLFSLFDRPEAMRLLPSLDDEHDLIGLKFRLCAEQQYLKSRPFIEKHLEVL